LARIGALARIGIKGCPSECGWYKM